MFAQNYKWLSPRLPLGQQDLVICSACNDIYMDYAVALVRSLDLFSPGNKFLLHLVNPTETTLDRAKDLRSELENTSLYISFERTDLSNLTPVQIRTYYACARFFRVQSLLSDVKAEWLVIDADTLFINPIDRDFTDKKNIAQLCLIRRDLGEEKPLEHLEVAAGTIWFRQDPEVEEFWADFVECIRREAESTDFGWFLDQVMLSRLLREKKGKLRYYNIKRKYADWTLSRNSIIWSAKGNSKYLDLRYCLLQKLLMGENKSKILAMRFLRNLIPESELNCLNFDFKKLISSSYLKGQYRKKKDVAIILPRLDLPWKKSYAEFPPLLADDAIKLRLKWKIFTLHIANALENVGIHVTVVEVPAWEINPEFVDTLDVDLALIPHRNFQNYKIGDTPVLFYMQEFFPDVFTVDINGWSASSSIYPIDMSKVPLIENGIFEMYRQRLTQGNLTSKFKQQNLSNYKKLVLEKNIPKNDYIFFPLQIPHDQSIEFFSDYSLEEVVRWLLEWREKSGVNIVFKPHPANMKATNCFESLIREHGGYWSQAHVYDLIKYSSGVYTINSGVGFEALFHLKPVVTFGRVEYDCLTFQAAEQKLDEAWSYCREATAPHARSMFSKFTNLFEDGDRVPIVNQDIKAGYERFVNWFLSEYAFDMSLDDSFQKRVRSFSALIKEKLDEAKIF